jgi:hypothetical protein
MAILSFAWTTGEFLSGKKTCTRRFWAPAQFARWCKFWDNGKLVHDAWDKVPFAGGKPVGKFELTCRPYLERLGDMPESDLAAEGGMCSTVDDFIRFVGKTADDVPAVVRFRKI